MKYFININQYATIKYGLDLDYNDLSVFDVLQDLMNSTKSQVINTINGDFFYIPNKLIIESLPLLKIKNIKGVKNRINKLIKCELIEESNDWEQNNITLYRPGKKFDLFFFNTYVNEI